MNVKWQTDFAGNDSAYVLLASLSGVIGGVLIETISYLAAAGDAGKLVQFNSSSAVTYTLLAVPSSTQWFVVVKNIGTGVLTILRNTTTIDGKSSNLTLSQGDAVVIYTDGTNYQTGSPRTISIGVFSPGVGTAAQVLLYLSLDRASTFPASAPNAYGVGKVAATASTTFTFLKNAVSFATANFAGTATVATWTQASDAVFAPGDILEIDGPLLSDATLANIGFTLQGYRF